MGIFPHKNISGFFVNVLKLVTGNVLAQGLAILVSPVLTRLFAPEAFGIAYLFSSITGIVSIVTCFRYDLAIVLPETDEEAASLLGLSVALVLVSTAISSFVIFAAGDNIARLLNAPGLEQYLWLAPIMICFQGLFMAFSYWITRRKQFGRITIATILQSFVTQSTKLVLGFAGYVSSGVLIITPMLGSFVSTGFLGALIWSRDSVLLRENLLLDRMVAGLRRYRRFPLIDTWSTLLNTVSWQLPSLLLAFFFSPMVVGFYALGFNLVKLPMGMVGSAIGQVFFQRASEAHRHGGLAELVTGLFRRLVSFGLFPLFILTAIGKELFVVVFGANWSEAGIFVQIMSPWLLFVLISSPLSTLPLVLEKQQVMLKFNIVVFATRFISLSVGGYMGSARVALFLFSGSGIMIYGFFSYYLIHLSQASRGKCSLFFLQYALAGLFGIAIILFAKTVIVWPPLFVGLSCLMVLLYEAIVAFRDPQIRQAIAIFLSRSKLKTSA